MRRRRPSHAEPPEPGTPPGSGASRPLPPGGPDPAGAPGTGAAQTPQAAQPAEPGWGGPASEPFAPPRPPAAPSVTGGTGAPRVRQNPGGPGGRPGQGNGHGAGNGGGRGESRGDGRGEGRGVGPNGRPAQRRRPAAARGLTAPGAVVVASGATLLGGVLNHMVADTLGAPFGIAFLATCALVAAKTRMRDLPAAVIAPPLAFALTILALSLFFPSDNGEGFLRRTVLDMFTALTFKAGVLWGGTALAGAVALVRFRADREATRRRAAGREGREVREGRDGGRADRREQGYREPGAR